MKTIMKWIGGTALTVLGKYLAFSCLTNVGDAYICGCFTGVWLLTYFDKVDQIWS